MHKASAHKIRGRAAYRSEYKANSKLGVHEISLTTKIDLLSVGRSSPDVGKGFIVTSFAEVCRRKSSRDGCRLCQAGGRETWFWRSFETSVSADHFGRPNGWVSLLIDIPNLSPHYGEIVSAEGGFHIPRRRRGILGWQNDVNFFRDVQCRLILS
jgi:hypothetical protein